MRFFVHGGGNERGPDGTRADAVYADAVADLLVGETAGEGHDGTFGGGVTVIG